jgi:hypothetical protein
MLQDGGILMANMARNPAGFRTRLRNGIPMNTVGSFLGGFFLCFFLLCHFF